MPMLVAILSNSTVIWIVRWLRGQNDIIDRDVTLQISMPYLIYDPVYYQAMSLFLQTGRTRRLTESETLWRTG